MPLQLRAADGDTWPRFAAGGGSTPDSCILYISASNKPVMGTRIYRLEPVSPAVVDDFAAFPGGHSAVVTDGPARIRSGPGLQHPRLSWCDTGLPLTVWTPALKGWLRASCYGVNGWIHESLVQIGDGSTQLRSSTPTFSAASIPRGEHQAVVIAGPARIRRGPGLNHRHLRWCGEGWPLTVWGPAQNGWMRASCYGSNGWIHFSLVEIGTAN